MLRNITHIETIVVVQAMFEIDLIIKIPITANDIASKYAPQPKEYSNKENMPFPNFPPTPKDEIRIIAENAKRKTATTAFFVSEFKFDLRGFFVNYLFFLP